MKVGGRPIGDGAPTLLIAELSANHNQDLDLALRTVDAAAEAGADAVKLQTYTPDTITFPGDAECFRISGGTAWDGRTLYDLYEEAHMPWEWHEPLMARAEQAGMLCFSTPFDPTAVDLLAELEVPAYKVASFEIMDLPLLGLVAAQGRPVLMSTGIADLGEIEAAVGTCREAGNDDLILLKCTSAYPALVSEANLRTMVDMARRFGVLVGLSDHTMGNAAAVAAVALGAVVVEKHFTLDRSAGGPDSGFSVQPAEFAELVRLVREVESALGRVSYELSPGAQVSRRHGRSLFVVEDVSAGDLVTEENVRSIRPADGLSPAELPDVLGRRFLVDATAGTPLSRSLLD